MNNRLDMTPAALFARISSELMEHRSFIESFVKEIVVVPGQTKVRYTMTMPAG